MKYDELEILSAIVRSPMLAPSVVALAKALNYPSRSTIYRIIDGTAGENAVAGLIERLMVTFGVGEVAINDMYRAIVWEQDMRAYLTDEFKSSPPRRRAHDIVIAFVTHNWEAFTDDFRRRALPELLRRESEQPVMFYAVLGYYYIREKGVNLYTPRRGLFKQGCEIIKPIGEELMEIYPENDAAITLLERTTRPEFYDSMPPLLVAFLGPFGTLLRSFACPGDTYQCMGQAVMPRVLTERTYWRGTDPERTLLLLQPIAGPKPGSGRYELYKVDPATAEAEFVAIVMFVDEDSLVLNNPSDEAYRYGEYRLSEEEFVIEWEREDLDPTGAGNRWTRLEPERSQTLRALDRRLTVESLDRSKLASFGADLMPGYEVDDVTLSRRQMSLSLRNGRTYSIALGEYGFMRDMHPSEPVRIIRTRIDGELMVHWPRLMMCVPLDRFKRED